MITELEFLAQVWIDDEDGNGGGLYDARVEVERSDKAEVRIGLKVEGEDDTTHIYLAPDRAIRLAQALIFETSKEWRV